MEVIGEENITLLQHDSYYRNLNHLPFEEREAKNFDHPEALETDLMIRHLRHLIEGETVEVPVYDFSRHLRTDRTETARPSGVILIDGILIFVEPSKRSADVIIPRGGKNEVALNMVNALIQERLSRQADLW